MTKCVECPEGTYGDKERMTQCINWVKGTYSNKLGMTQCINCEKGKYNNICNIPLPAGTNSEEYLIAFEYALKRLKEFQPEFVLISAGFDGHTADPLAQLPSD